MPVVNQTAQTMADLASRVAKLEAQSIKVNSRKDIMDAVNSAVQTAATSSAITDAGRAAALAAIRNVLRNTDAGGDMRDAIKEIIHGSKDTIMNMVVELANYDESFRRTLGDKLAELAGGTLDIPSKISAGIATFISDQVVTSRMEDAITTNLAVSSSFLRRVIGSPVLLDALNQRHRELTANAVFRLVPA